MLMPVNCIVLQIQEPYWYSMAYKKWLPFQSKETIDGKMERAYVVSNKRKYRTHPRILVPGV
jgi:hypothetical protein